MYTDRHTQTRTHTERSKKPVAAPPKTRQQERERERAREGERERERGGERETETDREKGVKGRDWFTLERLQCLPSHLHQLLRDQDPAHLPLSLGLLHALNGTHREFLTDQDNCLNLVRCFGNCSYQLQYQLTPTALLILKKQDIWREDVVNGTQ